MCNDKWNFSILILIIKLPIQTVFVTDNVGRGKYVSVLINEILKHLYAPGLHVTFTVSRRFKALIHKTIKAVESQLTCRSEEQKN